MQNQRNILRVWVFFAISLDTKEDNVSVSFSKIFSYDQQTPAVRLCLFFMSFLFTSLQLENKATKVMLSLEAQ